MGTLKARGKALGLAAALAIGSAGAASAADLGYPPAYAPAPVAVSADFSGWYLRGDVGIGGASSARFKVIDPTNALPTTCNRSATATSSYCLFNESTGHAFFVGLGVGYQFNNWFRADVTGEYRAGRSINAIDEGAYQQTFQGVTQTAATRNFYKGNISSSVLLFNGYVDLGSWYGITPFLGAGVGFAQNKVTNVTDQGFSYNPFNGNGYPTGGYFADASKTNFAWALHAGLGYSVTQNLKLEIAYRYLNMGTAESGGSSCFAAGPGLQAAGCSYKMDFGKLQEHDIKIGMRWMLGDASPAPVYAPAPQAPLVRKF